MTNNNHDITIPQHGENPADVLQKIRALKEHDVHWKAGKVWSLVYYAGEEHDQLLKDAYNELFSTNYLNPLAFKSLHTMEQEVVRMTANMLHAPKEAVGVMSSGGTESILLAMFCYRQRAVKLLPGIKHPEVVAPATIHPAFDKAAEMFGMRMKKAAVNAQCKAIPGKMQELITANTILIVASAPCYPNGVADPIESIATIANQHNLPMHVDACIGGFMLPWVEKLGNPVPLWDFRVEGVSSISADVHKFGFGAKGASVLTYRSMDIMHHQFVISTDFPGGIYISPTLLGTRPGGAIAAAWAGMMHMGENGYMAMADQLMRGARLMKEGLAAIPSVTVVGEPCMNIVSYTTTNNKPDIFVVADQMEDKGWFVDRQQHPDSIHLTILPTNLQAIDQYLADLKDAVAIGLQHPEAAARGNAAMYGLMSRIPFRGMVERSVEKIMEDMYGQPYNGGKATEENTMQNIGANAFWMGQMSRFLAAWKRWKAFFRHK